MVDRLLTPALAKSKKSFLILGPRQVGKSTLMQSLKPDMAINLARENEFLRYSSDPDLFVEQVEGSGAKSILVDEIQRIPGLLNSIQALVDESKAKSSIRFFLSGSSARKLRRGQANLLPGRVLSYQLGGFCLKELNYDVEFEKVLKHGFLPEPCLETNSRDAEDLLRSYSATYLKEEIQAEALSRNIQGFARFLMSLASSSGQVLDFSKLASRAKVSRTGSIRFVEILEDTLIAERVPSFSGSKRADVIKHPKLYFFDVGVLNGLLGSFATSEDRKGVLFEHLIYSQLRNSAFAHQRPMTIEFFRTRHGTEVDFIINLDGETWAIEVKSGEVGDSDLRGLKAFREYYPKVKELVVVTPKGRKRRKDGVLICDWVTLFKELGF